MADGYGAWAAAVVGACIGSFLNVVIWRVPRGEFLSRGRRSVCPACGARIPWYRNLPLLSWLLLRGRASCCGAAISSRYLVVEAVTAALFALLWIARVDPSPDAVTGRDVALFALLAYFVATLVACTFIDIEHRLLPDVLTKPAMAVGLIGSFLLPGALGSLAPRELTPAVSSLLFSAVGLAAGFALTWGIRAVATMVFRKEAMGFGDVKFMAAIGAFLGWEDVLLTFFLGCVLGAVGGVIHRLATGDAYVPFGPFLAGGALSAVFFGGQIKQFLFVTWPEWQQENAAAPLILVALVIVISLLFVVARRGRDSQPPTAHSS
jgi:leader peptidase (prepilin peptidase)/N-methyltransferase